MINKSKYEINCLAMAIVNRTNEINGVDVETRQKSNEACFDFAVKKIRDFLTPGNNDPLTQYKQALNEVCTDLACDDQCPDQMADFEPWLECENCPGRHGEIHQDTERDIRCFERYYLNKAAKALSVSSS